MDYQRSLYVLYLSYLVKDAPNSPLPTYTEFQESLYPLLVQEDEIQTNKRILYDEYPTLMEK